MIRLQEWARQIRECQYSGQSVKQWCAERGINRKTYYTRLRVLQEEMLNTWEPSDAVQQRASGEIKSFHGNTEWGPNHRNASERDRNEHEPVFAALSVSPVREASVTVRIGEYAVDIHTDADEKIVGHVLRAVTRL